MNTEGWTSVELPPLTLPVLSINETAKIISTRVQEIGNGDTANLEEGQFYVSTKELTAAQMVAIDKSDVINVNGRSNVRLWDTEDIAKAEFNVGSVHYDVIRILYKDHEKRVVYYERISFSEFKNRPILPYMSALI